MLLEGPMMSAAGASRRRVGQATAMTRRSALVGGTAVAAAFLGKGTARAARVLRLGHGLPSTHPVHQSMLNFAEIVAHRTQEELTIAVYSDGLLGEEPDLLELIKAGALDLTKASASVLDGINPQYRVFNIPFLLQDKQHWRRVTTGQLGESILAFGTREVFGLTFYDAGARSFYGQRSIVRPEDLRGLTIRVQPSPSTMRMIQILEAEPRPMPWNLVYSALQTGLIDGAENNITALTFGRHAEVVKYYSLTEHTMVPDVLLVSRQTWEGLPERHRSIVRSAAMESALLQGVLWEHAEEESRRTATRLGIIFEEPDKDAFVRKLAPLKQEFAERGGLAQLIAAIERA